MEKVRCKWSGTDELYIRYHDEEWGKPIFDDRLQFEFLTLEIFQAGLSWFTILKKRENFRAAFDQFDYKKVALYNEDKIQSLLNNKDIIRNQLKIRATINNASAFMKIQDEFESFSNYIWSFVDGEPLVGHWETEEELPTKTELSDEISKDLKKRGFKFIGSTIVYSHLQATGIVNDHVKSCFRYKEV